jgi:hypothetical protein
MHASTLVFFIAYITFASAILFANMDKNFFKNSFLFKTQFQKIKLSIRLKMLLFLCVFLIGYIAIPQAGLQMMYRKGVINNFETHTFLQHLVVGLDVESNGGFSNNQSLIRLRSYPPELRHEVATKIIREQLQDPVEIGWLIARKTYYTYFFNDSTFVWYSDHHLREHASIAPEDMTTYQLDFHNRINSILNGMRDLDRAFVHFLFLLAALGLILKKYSKAENIYYLQIIIIIGMFIVTGLGETQPRYRYPAMPSLVILASVGFFEVLRLYESAKAKILAKFA